jgi:hypothetical protein
MLTQNKSPASRLATSARTPWHRSSVPPHLELLRLPGDFGRGPGGPTRWRFHHEKMVSHMGILMWYNKGCYQELKIDGGVDGFFWIMFEVNGSMIQRWEMSKKRKGYLVGGSFNPSEKWWSSSVGMMKFPTEWKVIKFHGSQPPSSKLSMGHLYPQFHFKKKSWSHGDAPEGDPQWLCWRNKEALNKHPFSSLYPPLSHGKCMKMSGLNRSKCKMLVDKPMAKPINK